MSARYRFNALNFLVTTFHHLYIAHSLTSDSRADEIDLAAATEDVGSKFTIERGTNGREFSVVGTVPGKGSNSGYSFYDANSYWPVTYYRLRMNDPGAADTYSKIVSVRRRGNEYTLITPNPATNFITITTTDASLNGKPAFISDIHGRRIYTFVVKNTQRINVSSWAAGVYVLTMGDGVSMKIVKH